MKLVELTCSVMELAIPKKKSVILIQSHVCLGVIYHRSISPQEACVWWIISKA